MRTKEAIHQLAWRDLLDLVPGAMQALIDQAASQNGVTAETLCEGATIGFNGRCGSDLFLVCNECRRDRTVIEIKGKTAKVNWLKKLQAWQTDFYRGRYQDDPARACEHLRLPTPPFIFLDAKDRTREVIEENECYGEPALDGWAVLTYEEVLSREPFANRPLALWLLGH